MLVWILAACLAVAIAVAIGLWLSLARARSRASETDALVAEAAVHSSAAVEQETAAARGGDPTDAGRERADTISQLAEEERRLGEERRATFAERERRAGEVLADTFADVERRLDERLQGVADDLDGLNATWRPRSLD